MKVDIALQSIKQISYKNTIDWEHNTSANLGIGVHVQKKKIHQLFLSHLRIQNASST